MKQVGKEAYDFSGYVGIDRWSSYYYQLQEILAQKPESVLEIGVGDRVVGSYLKRNSIAYTSVDIAEDLAPDIIASVTDLPFPDATFDVVCAFEVLEHLPFDQFEIALKEMNRVSKKVVLLSLPHFGPSLRLELKLPLLPRMRVAWKISIPKRHSFSGQHYWEIGKRGYALGRIRGVLASLLTIEKDFVPFENQYHHFFLLKKKRL